MEGRPFLRKGFVKNPLLMQAMKMEEGAAASAWSFEITLVLVTCFLLPVIGVMRLKNPTADLKIYLMQ